MLFLQSILGVAAILIFDYSITCSSSLVIENFTSRFSKVHRGKMFGLNEWMKMLGWAIGPILGGYAWDTFSHRAPFQISMAVEFCLIPAYIIGMYFLSQYMTEKVHKDKVIALEQN